MVQSDEKISIAVGPYLTDDEVSNIGGEPLNYSETGLGSQRIQVAINREVKIVWGVFKGADNAICEMIECAPLVVDSISCHHSQEVNTRKKGGPVKSNFNTSFSSVKVVLDGQSVGACLMHSTKRLFDISDVFTSPFHLRYCAFECATRMLGDRHVFCLR